MPAITFESSTIFYREFGDAAAPPLVLIHGLYADSTSVESLAVVLGVRFRVIAPDMLGHGRSSRPERFSLADQGRALNHLIAALGYESSAVVGVSMGSYVAAQAAILDPARTSRLVLVVPKAHGTSSSVAAYAARQGIDLRNAAPEQLVGLMAGALWSPATSQERRDEIMAAIPADQIVLSAEEQGAVERSLANFDLRPGLPAITAPTLVISGRADGLNPPEAGEEVAKLIPGAEFKIYEDSGHMLTAEEPTRLVADIMAFAAPADNSTTPTAD
jgi:3-oxoadipate enol-lactonase